MNDEFNLWLTGGALALGAFFGIVCQRSRFCVVAALSNLVLMRDYRQLHAYLAALAAALAGTGLLETPASTGSAPWAAAWSSASAPCWRAGARPGP